MLPEFLLSGSREQFGTENSLVGHFVRNTKEKPYVCDVCKKHFGDAKKSEI